MTDLVYRLEPVHIVGDAPNSFRNPDSVTLLLFPIQKLKLRKSVALASAAQIR